MENKYCLESLEKELRKKCDAFEICYSDSHNSGIGFENNKLFSMENNYSSGLGIRLVKNGKIGFSFTTNPEKIKETVGYAIESSKYGERALFELPCRRNKKREVKTYDENVEKIDLKKRISFGKQIIRQINSEIPDLNISLGFSKTIDNFVLINSNGVRLEDKSSEYSFGITLLSVNEKKGLLDISESKSRANIITDEEIGGMIKTLKTRYNKANKTAKIKQGAYPAIFNKYSVGILYSCFLAAINGKTFQKGISPLSDKINKKIIDSRITMRDNPFIDYMSGSAEFDAEGLPAYEKPLIEKGVFKNFIFDLKTASLVNKKSTANAARSFASQPQPSFTNITVDAGETDYSKMISDIDEGILIEQAIGAGQSNTLAGDFSVNIDLGYLIKNGKISGRVKDCMIAGNVYDLFNDIKCLSKDLFYKSSMITPAVCFNKINVAV
ncbi:MAG TPA: metallopeptidase TldD-related protein [bacterium]|mgnify:CR=1 FL=1|nr:metallopeptidase TldD-related protein [bacterium]HPN29699.1 metallopeptidase TldD-related protein [bacterium]